jgi:hypothetical protein
VLSTVGVHLAGCSSLQSSIPLNLIHFLLTPV